MKRCPWCENNELYMKYHDQEWGVPVHDDIKLFEFLILEGAQAGLSWLTVLRKRENYRKAYDYFDPKIVAEYDDKKIGLLLANKGIIRNKVKIKASVHNAQKFLAIQKEFGNFDSYIWQFVDNTTIVNSWETDSEVPSKTEVSDRISSDLKKRGFKFVGSTIIYAHMQATGMVNDHIRECFRYNQLIEK